MGQLHNELNPRANLSKAVRAILGSVDTEGGLERFSETLQVGIDLWSRLEFALPRGEVWWEFGNISAGPVVGQNSFIKVFAPNVSPGLITVIDGYQIVGQVGAQNIAITLSSPDLPGTLSQPFVVDARRLASSGAPATAETGMNFGTTAAGVSGSQIRSHLLPAGTDGTPTPLGVVLRGNMSLIFWTVGQNLPLTVNVRGHEFRLGSSERVV